MIAIIKTRFRNWLRRDKVILSHHRMIDIIGSLTIQTAIDLQDVIDEQLAILKRVAHFMDDKHAQKKALDSIARFESETDAQGYVGRVEDSARGSFPEKAAGLNRLLFRRFNAAPIRGGVFDFGDWQRMRPRSAMNLALAAVELAHYGKSHQVCPVARLHRLRDLRAMLLVGSAKEGNLGESPPHRLPTESIANARNLNPSCRRF